jgi:hypothetical protein
MDEKEADRLVARVRDAAELYHESATNQWYVDERCIDCDADEFWALMKKTLMSSG